MRSFRYGTYGNYWSHCAEPFKEFLCDLNRDYLLGKISTSQTSYEDAESRLKRRVLSARREGRVSEDDAREAWDEIGDAFCDYSGEMAVMSLYDRGSLAGIVNDFTDIFACDFPREARQFADRLWPAIVDHLSKEQAE